MKGRHAARRRGGAHPVARPPHPGLRCPRDSRIGTSRWVRPRSPVPPAHGPRSSTGPRPCLRTTPRWPGYYCALRVSPPRSSRVSPPRWSISSWQRLASTWGRPTLGGSPPTSRPSRAVVRGCPSPAPVVRSRSSWSRCRSSGAAWEVRLVAPRAGTRRLRSNAAAWRVLDLLPRHLVLTGPLVAKELGIPLKSANAALRDLVVAGVLAEHGTVQPSGRGRPSRLYTSAELLGLTGSNPLRG